jgi:RNA polymerase sigma factor (sigma-70 family)
MQVDWDRLWEAAGRYSMRWQLPGCERDDLRTEAALALIKGLKWWQRARPHRPPEEYYGAPARAIVQHHLTTLYRQGLGARRAERRWISTPLSLDKMMTPGDDDQVPWEPAAPPPDDDTHQRMLDASSSICRHLIARLPARHRAAIQGHYLDGKPLAEIAQALGCEPWEIGRMCEDGIRQLREQLRQLAARRGGHA